MQNRHAGDAVAESTEERPAAVAPTRDAKYSRSRSGNGQVTENGPGAATQQAGGGNGREPTIRELQMGIQANRQRIIRLEKQTKKGFKRTHREIRELRGGQTRMAGEIRERIRPGWLGRSGSCAAVRPGWLGRSGNCAAVRPGWLGRSGNCAISSGRCGDRCGP